MSKPSDQDPFEQYQIAHRAEGRACIRGDVQEASHFHQVALWWADFAGLTEDEMEQAIKEREAA